MSRVYWAVASPKEDNSSCRYLRTVRIFVRQMASYDEAVEVRPSQL
jgi:hypothetical protein